MVRAKTTEQELDRLLIRTAQGDREALAELYRLTRGKLYAFALGLVKCADEAQDVTQDAFVRIWKSAPQYRSQGFPLGWMLTIVKNLARMRLRRAARQELLDEDAWQAVPSRENSVTFEDRIMLQQALGRLGNKERQIVLLHAVSGLKHRETAALLETPLATVLSSYSRALKKLRMFMEGDDAG